jgi:hypothetical protein
MAAIDKMYLRKWEDYVEFKKWCEAQPPLTDKYGKKERITEYLYEYDEPFTREMPVFMAPCYVDAYVIRNCPLEEMQKELKLHYGQSYDEIKAGKLYNKPTTNEMPIFIGYHCTMTKWPGKKYNRPIIGDLQVEIDVPDDLPYMWYNNSTDTWDFCDEYVISEWVSSVAYVRTIKTLKRKIRKWKLPAGTKVRAYGRYVGEDWEFIVKL